MPCRALGRSGLHIAPLAFGGNVSGWTADRATSLALLDAFVDGGFKLIDTADVYSRWVPGHSGGESASLIGAWLSLPGNAGKRQRMLIATQVGKDMGGDAATPRIGLLRRRIRPSVEDLLCRLRRLRTDRSDRYQSHDDDAMTPLQETLAAYAELIGEGKVRAIGASKHLPAPLTAALALSARLGLARYQSLQPLYNLMDRAACATALEPLCRAEGLGVINFFGLARGFLSGKLRSEADLAESPHGAGCKASLNDRGRRVPAALDAVAQARGARPAQVALAWQIYRPNPKGRGDVRRHRALPARGS